MECAGEELYPLVLNMEPDLAGKITGMLLEMSEGDVIAIIEDHVACQDKVFPEHVMSVMSK